MITFITLAVWLALLACLVIGATVHRADENKPKK